MKLLLAGATGLVGHQVLLKALARRIDPAKRIADALLEAALNPSVGVRTITTEHLVLFLVVV
ncbi:hypothetical protein [Dickeya solani]|uniref:NAD(P)-binding domain-containing protein n=1 Tax=Dickeya solani D s0432-1 TaxID=1231725 RepID=A0AAV3K878_9GAMM|nr:hypothetical protein [Dickeya solani]ANE74759.1 hypothetical protein A4U42_05125 [Dickeya solani IPO 2222]AUC42061.1 hypothetical protein D083_1712 [Dickeya solani RNS 08.23.3.1.A]AUH09827.1 hypothetical protein BJD21_15915 [Dickeya solani D s0432-1]AUH13785.1 hypothetical protein BJJ98_15885 [Dickeya solani]AYQ49265.1 hypothetical protein CTB91_03511 [Dickeya solani]